MIIELCDYCKARPRAPGYLYCCALCRDYAEKGFEATKAEIDKAYQEGLKERSEKEAENARTGQ